MEPKGGSTVDHSDSPESWSSLDGELQQQQFSVGNKLLQQATEAAKQDKDYRDLRVQLGNTGKWLSPCG